MKGGMEVSATPTTPKTPATEAGAASKSASRQIRVIQFCHLKKHCSKETCLDYMDMESMMKEENQGKEIYTTNREGVSGRDPLMLSSVWRDWKSEKGTIQLIKDLYPENFQSGQSDDFVVYQVDDPEETLEQNRPPEGEEVDYIFFINCPFRGSKEKSSKILQDAKIYATPETKCLATCGIHHGIKDCPNLISSEHTEEEEDMNFFTHGGDSFVKFKFKFKFKP